MAKIRAQKRSLKCVKEALTISAIRRGLLCVLPRPNCIGQAHMTCCIDHDAENAIPLFLCVACGRVGVTEHRLELDVANAIYAAVDLGQRSEPTAHVP